MSWWRNIESIVAKIRSLISSAKALSGNIEEIHMVVLLDITLYDLVPAPESIGTNACISAKLVTR